MDSKSVDFFLLTLYTDRPFDEKGKRLQRLACPDSSVVEHLHGKQKVVGSIPILGRL